MALAGIVVVPARDEEEQMPGASPRWPRRRSTARSSK